MREPTFLVSVGSYHRPYDRLLNTVARWQQEHPEVHLIVQHGPGAPVAGAENYEFLSWDTLTDLMSEADALVLQGGAGGIMDSHCLHRVPIVMPRMPSNGEVVDDHQLHFSECAEKLGLAYCARDEAALTGYLDKALSGSLVTRKRADIGLDSGVRTVEELLAARELHRGKRSVLVRALNVLQAHRALRRRIRSGPRL